MECETSLPVPAVVGMQTSGMIGPGTLSNPKQSCGFIAWVKAAAVFFDKSMLLPPPSPITTSGAHSFAKAKLLTAVAIDGSASPAVKTSISQAASTNGAHTLSTKPAASMFVSVTIRTRCHWYRRAISAICCKQPRPNTSCPAVPNVQ